jgi:hypothetical protein
MDQVRVHGISPRHLRHRKPRRRCLRTNLPLLVIRPKTLLSLAHRVPLSVHYRWWTLSRTFTLSSERVHQTLTKRLALYDLRSDKGVEVPEFAVLLVLEITNSGRTPIFLSRADCLVDTRATRLLHPREVLCFAFAGSPLDDYVGFVSDGLESPSISNFGSMAVSAPLELLPGGIGYVTLLLNHNPEPPFPEGRQLRFQGVDTSRWDAEDERRTDPFMHRVMTVRSLDALYGDETLYNLLGNELQSFVGANVWLETTKGTRLDPVSFASLVFSEDAANDMGRSFFGFLDNSVDGN